MADQDSNNEKNVLDDLNYTSGQISNLVRVIGLALMGIPYGFLLSQNPTIILLVKQASTLVLLTLVSGIFTILFEFFQNTFGYLNSQKALSRKDKPFLYNKSWPERRLRFFFYYLKQSTALLGCIFLFIVLIQLYCVFINNN